MLKPNDHARLTHILDAIDQRIHQRIRFIHILSHKKRPGITRTSSVNLS